MPSRRPPLLTLRLALPALLLLVASLSPVSSHLRADDAPPAAAATPEGIEFFEKKIRPLFVKHCTECHSAEGTEPEGDLRLDTAAGWRRGGHGGPALVPGDPDASLLMRAVRYKDSELQMPPENKLSDAEIDLLAQWIKMGAPDPRQGDAADSTAPRKKMGMSVAEGRDFWAFQPVVRPQLPAVRDMSLAATPIDRFVVAALEEKGLAPAAPASRRVLIRRAYFDLTGLPPTPEQVERFVNDPAPDAFATVVDELLESPAYGERWGRHWLDVARYADSNGLDENVAFGNAWRYRDYVVQAFNRDKPYDEFVREQIAGDLIATDDPALRQERLIATGFLSLGAKVLAEPDKTKMQMDIIDEQVDTLGKAFLGLTLGCARCHDHKFDPVPTADYYALAGILRSTKTMEPQGAGIVSRWWENSIASAAEEEQSATHTKQVADLKARITAATAEEKPTLEAELKELEKKAPVLPTALGVTEAEPVNLKIHRRGSHLTLGEEVPRGFLRVVSTEAPADDRAIATTDAPIMTAIPSERSGRLELAEWLTRREHPLTARVMVNRVWRWHFGQGLSNTTDNFGILGERPAIPPLLEWLASEFVEQGWSIKKLHRVILLSQVYQRSSDPNPDGLRIDPENRLHWRFSLRRLEAEEIRDGLLAVAGTLDRTVGGDTCKLGNRSYIFDHTSKDATGYDIPRRSIYLPVIRNHVYDLFQQFDFPEPSVVSGDRASTTVSPQALLLLNSDLVLSSSEKLAARLLAEPDRDEEGRIDRAYQLAFGRSPTASETSAALDFLAGFGPPPADGAKPQQRAWEALAQVLLTSNEFLYVR